MAKRNNAHPACTPVKGKGMLRRENIEAQSSARADLISWKELIELLKYFRSHRYTLPRVLVEFEEMRQKAAGTATRVATDDQVTKVWTEVLHYPVEG